MHILYVIHAFPWNEATGATLILDNYVRQATLLNITVSIMVPEIAYKHIEYSEYGDAVRLYSFRSQENWAISGFDFALLNEEVTGPVLAEVPDLVHVIDWVSFHPALHPYLKSLGCPIVRSVCNFEEFCPLTTPVFYNSNAEPCHVPLAPEQCLDCVADHTKLTVPGALYTYKVLLRDLVAYRNNCRQGMVPLLSRRTDFVRNLFKNFVDYVVFPSESFGRYFLAHLECRVDFKVINHGLGEVPAVPMRESTLPIRIIYTGGDRAAKGWEVMAGAFEILSKEPNSQFEIHCVGNIQGIPEHYFQNPNVRLIPSPAYRRNEEVEVLSSFDIAIAPSQFESYGLFVRECVRSKVIPIVTPSMGVSEFIAKGENGFELEHPYAENLAKLILALAADVNALTALRAGLNVSSVPTATAEFGELLGVYQDLLKVRDLSKAVTH